MRSSLHRWYLIMNRDRWHGGVTGTGKIRVPSFMGGDR